MRRPGALRRRTRTREAARTVPATSRKLNARTTSMLRSRKLTASPKRPRPEHDGPEPLQCIRQTVRMVLHLGRAHRLARGSDGCLERAELGERLGQPALGDDRGDRRDRRHSAGDLAGLDLEALPE